MNKISHILNLKKRIHLNSRAYKILGILIVALVANHLAKKDNFPFFNEGYHFPLYSTILSIFLGPIILAIAEFNFKYFEKKYFTEKITPRNLIGFLSSTLGYITAIYLPIYFGAVWVLGGFYDLYHLSVGLLITLLISSLAIIFIYAKSIYRLYKSETLEGNISFKRNGETFLINYNEVAYIYSENKIVFIVKTDGKSVMTNFTLNEVESRISEQLFFKANRQTILHCHSIQHFKSIENGKLLVTLKPTDTEKNNREITISRYRKKSFEEWFAQNL